jgi:hypothetical protein
MINIVNKIESSLQNEDWDESLENSLELDKKWNKKSNILCMFVNHSEIDNTYNETSKLIQYVQTESKDEALASLSVIKFYISHINDLQKISLKNIL